MAKACANGLFRCYTDFMTRITGANISTSFGNLQPQAQAKSAEKPQVGKQVQQALFGKARPPLLDPAKFPQLGEQLKLLAKYKKKLAEMAGDEDDDYRLALADGTIAMIDQEGTIFVGAGFLQACGDQAEVMVGVLAHEIGHRPKRWNAYRTRRQLSREELETLCRHEETRADIFAGKALAEMEMDWEPLAAFLLRIQDKPHPEYFDAQTRAEVVRDAHEGRAYRTKARRALFPEYHRMKSPKGHLGEY